MKYLLGTDIGGTMTKAVIYDINGHEISSHSRATPVNIYNDVYIERDMTEMWRITADCIRKAIEKAGCDPSDIISIGCTGHGKGLYLWGKDDKPAYSGIASTDRRAADTVKAWTEDGTAKRASDISLQTVIECQPAALLSWLKKHERKVYDNIKWVFEAKDYIRLMLTNEAYAEITDYSGTSLMNLKNQSFDKELFMLFGIEEMYEKMPPLKFSSDLCGKVTKEAALITGLKEGTHVCGGMFDIDACGVAMNITDPDTLGVITGTWSINEYASEEYVPYDTSTKNSLFCIPGYYLIEESSPTSAGNLDWYLNNCMNHGGKEGKEIYKKADAMVASVNPETSGVIFYPFLYGTNIKGLENACFIGLNSGHTGANMIRAVYEGVVFSHKMHIDKLLTYRNRPEKLRIAGGSTNSDVWMQMFADIMGTKCEVIDEKELGTLGACMAAGIQAGLFEDYEDASSKMVKIRKTFYPDPTLYDMYDRKYKRYMNVADSLRKAGV